MYVSRNELYLTIIKAFGGNISDEGIQEWIKEGDSDGNEKVNFKEFLRCKIKYLACDSFCKEL